LNIRHTVGDTKPTKDIDCRNAGRNAITEDLLVGDPLGVLILEDASGMTTSGEGVAGVLSELKRAETTFQMKIATEISRIKKWQLL
jgi:hypothetical protein